MNLHNMKRSIVALLLMALVGSLLGVARPASAQDVSKVLVVVNQANSLESISMSDLSSVFLKEKGSVNGQNLKPINLNLGTPGRTLFDKKVHSMSESEMEDYWNQKKVSGEGTAPSSQGSAAPLFMLLTQSGQAIGYVPESAWSEDQYGGSIKVLDIVKNGTAHGPDSGDYPLTN